MTMKATRIAMKRDVGEKSKFTINEGLKQGDALSAHIV